MSNNLSVDNYSISLIKNKGRLQKHEYDNIKYYIPNDFFPELSHIKRLIILVGSSYFLADNFNILPIVFEIIVRHFL
jgi:hypothetical protein